MVHTFVSGARKKRSHGSNTWRRFPKILADYYGKWAKKVEEHVNWREQRDVTTTSATAGRKRMTVEYGKSDGGGKVQGRIRKQNLVRDEPGDVDMNEVKTLL